MTFYHGYQCKYMLQSAFWWLEQKTQTPQSTCSLILGTKLSASTRNRVRLSAILCTMHAPVPERLAAGAVTFAFRPAASA